MMMPMTMSMAAAVQQVVNNPASCAAVVASMAVMSMKNVMNNSGVSVSMSVAVMMMVVAVMDYYGRRWGMMMVNNGWRWIVSSTGWVAGSRIPRRN